MQEQQHHQNAGRLHDVDMQRRAGEAAEMKEQHRIAAGEQCNDARPHPGKEPGKYAPPQRKP
jgi:hypothetical protein